MLSAVLVFGRFTGAGVFRFEIPAFMADRLLDRANEALLCVPVAEALLPVSVCVVSWSDGAGWVEG